MKSLRQAADSSNLYKRPRADLPEIGLHDVRHKHSKVNVDAKIDWKTLYETVARAAEILEIDVQDLDPDNRQAPIRSKGGAIQWVYWDTGTAHLLPR